MDLTEHALKLLRENPQYVKDAREGAPVGNSAIGCIMSVTLHTPRWMTENAVWEALELFDKED